MAKKPMTSLLDEMLHPIRMRIMITLAGGQELTPLQIADVLPDVPQATLYRHINRLVQGGILTVVAERQVRGTTEKVYALNQSTQTHLNQDAMASLTKDDHMRYFSSFVTTLLGEFNAYLQQSPKVDMAADGVGYSQVVLFMSDEDLMDFSRKINEALMPYITNTVEKGKQPRRKRILSTVMMPAAEKQDLKGLE